MLTFVGGGFATEISAGYIVLFAILSLLLPITFHVLRAIGLYKLSKRKKLKHAFVAWIPVAWVYVLCKLVAEYRIFGKSIGKLAWLITSICVLSFLLVATYEFLIYFPFVGNYLAGRNIFIVSEASDITTEMVPVWQDFYLLGELGAFKNPYTNLKLIDNVLTIISLFTNVFGLVETILLVTLFINLFKKYWPQRFMLAAILSIFGIDGPFVFAIRNKEPVNYMDYLRQRYHAYGAPYGNPYGNPYGPQNPYGAYNQSQGSGAQKQPDNPFEDFEDKNNKKPEDPFSDFD